MVKCVGKGRGHTLLKEANAVTLDDVQACLKKYIVPLFDAASSVAAVACSPSTEEAIVEQLGALGYQVAAVNMPGAGSSDTEESSYASDTLSESGSETDASA